MSTPPRSTTLQNDPTSQANVRAKAATPVQGSTPLYPNSLSKGVQKGTVNPAATGKAGGSLASGGSPTDMAAQAVANKFGQDSLVGKAAKRAADGIQAARLLAGDMTQLLPFLKKHWLKICLVFLLLFAPVGAAAGMAIGLVLGPRGDETGDVGVGDARSTVGATGCKEMTSSLKLPASGRTINLFEVKGTFSQESAIDQYGRGLEAAAPSTYGKNDPTGNIVALAGLIKKKGIPLDSDLRHFYAAARWSYAGTNKKRGVDDKASDYAGTKIVFYNPATGKAVVAGAADWGPGEKEGGGGIVGGGPKLHAYAPANVQPWDSKDDQNSKYADDGPTLASELGLVKGNEEIVMGFLSPELTGRYTYGDVLTCTPDSDVGEVRSDLGVKYAHKDPPQDGTPHFVKNLPGIRQEDGDDCGSASATAMILFYKPELRSTLVADVKGYAVNKYELMSSGDPIGDRIGKDYGIIRSTVTAEQVKRSIDGGDPVMVYMRAGNNVTSSGVHWVVISGYDNKYFYTHDPYPRGAGCSTCGGEIWIYSSTGRGSNGRDGIEQAEIINNQQAGKAYIRSKYIK